jgi:hypothetical protein
MARLSYDLTSDKGHTGHIPRSVRSMGVLSLRMPVFCCSLRPNGSFASWIGWLL